MGIAVKRAPENVFQTPIVLGSLLQPGGSAILKGQTYNYAHTINNCTMVCKNISPFCPESFLGSDEAHDFIVSLKW